MNTSRREGQYGIVFHHTLWPERPYRGDFFEKSWEFGSDRPPEKFKMVGFWSRIEFGRNGTHQIDRSFDPNAMEGFPGQFYKVSDQFFRVLG